MVNWLHCLMLTAKAYSTSDNTHSWKQAMNGYFARECWYAACVEVETLEKIKAWEVNERKVNMNVVSST